MLPQSNVSMCRGIFCWNYLRSAACGCLQVSLLCNLRFDLFICDWVSVLLGSAAKAGATPVKCVKMQGHIFGWDTCGVLQVPPSIFDTLCFIALCLQLRLLRGRSVKRPRVRACTVLQKTTLLSKHSQAGQDTTRTPHKSIRNLLLGIGSRQTAPTSVRRMPAPMKLFDGAVSGVLRVAAFKYVRALRPLQCRR